MSEVFPCGFLEVSEELMWRFEIRNCFVNTEVISKDEFRLNLAVCSLILSNIS